MSDIIERAEAILRRDMYLPDSTVRVIQGLVAALKAARAEIIRLTPNEAGYAGRD